MIERYTRPEMERIWSEQFRFETWMKVEIAAFVAHNLTLTSQVIANNNKLEAFNNKRTNGSRGNTAHIDARTLQDRLPAPW